MVDRNKKAVKPADLAFPNVMWLDIKTFCLGLKV